MFSLLILIALVPVDGGKTCRPFLPDCRSADCSNQGLTDFSCPHSSGQIQKYFAQNNKITAISVLDLIKCYRDLRYANFLNNHDLKVDCWPNNVTVVYTCQDPARICRGEVVCCCSLPYVPPVIDPCPGTTTTTTIVVSTGSSSSATTTTLAKSSTSTTLATTISDWSSSSSTTATTTTSSATTGGTTFSQTTTNSSATTEPVDANSSAFGTGAIVGVVLAGALILLSLLGLFCLWKWWQRRLERRQFEEFLERMENWTPSSTRSLSGSSTHFSDFQEDQSTARQAVRMVPSRRMTFERPPAPPVAVPVPPPGEVELAEIRGWTMYGDREFRGSITQRTPFAAKYWKKNRVGTEEDSKV